MAAGSDTKSNPDHHARRKGLIFLVVYTGMFVLLLTRSPVFLQTFYYQPAERDALIRSINTPSSTLPRKEQLRDAIAYLVSYASTRDRAIIPTESQIIGAGATQRAEALVAESGYVHYLKLIASNGTVLVDVGDPGVEVPGYHVYTYYKPLVSDSDPGNVVGELEMKITAPADFSPSGTIRLRYYLLTLLCFALLGVVYWLALRMHVMPLLSRRWRKPLRFPWMAHLGVESGEASAESPLRSKLRGASILIVATLLYLAAVAGSLYTIETAYYLPKKKEMITNWLKESKYIDFESATRATDMLKLYALRRHTGTPEENLVVQKEEGLARMRQLMEDSPVITRIQLLDSNERILMDIQDHERVQKLHDFSNSLLTRNFESSVQQPFRVTERETIAVFRVYVTTAKGNPDIEALTAYYRLWMLGFIAGFTLLYLYMLFFILLPLSRVSTYMQRKGVGISPFIRNVRSHLERSYNHLARDASLTRYSKELREFIATEGLSHTEPILERVPQLVEEIFGIRRSQIWTFARNSSADPWRVERLIARTDEADEETFRTHLLGMIGKNDPFLRPEGWSSAFHNLDESDVAIGPFFCDMLVSTEERLVLFLIRFSPWDTGTTSWWQDFYGKAAQELRYALNSVEEQRRMILQEKSKANISLSRNLGHDLTNIIATSKLELMTIRAFLSLSAEDMKNSPRKEALFRESLEALLNNTRFLQEIVNLYRSFSYLQKPKFEEVEIVELVKDVVKLYELSNSRHIRITTVFDGELPRAIVEPRLLRLALFNMLTNAADAIKKATSADTPEGMIHIEGRYSESHKRIEIKVKDTGTGIRDEHGKLLSADAISQIFRLGFSTKADQEGEGLGLNWVQTIVREFHGGEIVASNRPEGGAAFTIRLPIERDSQAESRIPPVVEERQRAARLQEV